MNIDYTKLNHVTNIHEKYAISQLEDNLKSFLDWSLLQIDGYINVHANNGGRSTLYTMKPSIDPANSSALSAKIWETPVKDWIWESGQPDAPSSLVPISGVNVNNVFLPAPSGSGNYTYYINYPLGRIVFTNPISNDSEVYISYSYRYIQIYKANESNWWKQLSDISYQANNNSNYATLLSENRVNLPFIIIETVSRNQQIPWELGSSKNRIIQDVLLHVFSDNPSQRTTISDILLAQKDKGIILYDINKVAKNGVYGLNYRGEKNINGLNYQQIITNPEYQYKYCYIKNAIMSENNAFSSSLFNSVIRWSIEIFP
jgi:hypothetical protein